MTTTHHLACDLGAESGRVMLGTLSDGALTLEELHRFPTGGARIAGSLRWDVLRFFEEIKTGLRRAAARGLAIAGISADSWGVDYCLIRDREPMLTLPFHYRDSRTDGGFERAFQRVPSERIFAETGIQFMLINTLYQLDADLRDRPDLLAASERFLTIGDYFNFCLGGVARIEQSQASTTQLYNPRTRSWSDAVIAGLGLPRRIFPQVVPSGTVLGPLLSEVAEETGLQGCQVIATCSHDTGAAVAAIPAEDGDWAFLSSGTWSLLGIESPEPIITEASRAANFTNEIGFGGTIRFLKNIIGLWIVQECRRAWAGQGQELGYDELTRLAEAAQPLSALINPADPRFGKPAAMPERIEAYCRETGQKPPEGPGATIRCVLESLALSYRQNLDLIASITSRRPRRLHIVGGGSKNQLLNQFAADATGLTVLAGPVEATAMGNVLIQAIALGRLKGLPALRAVVRASALPTTFTPHESARWQDAYDRFRRLP